MSTYRFTMAQLLRTISLIGLVTTSVYANTEKTIFLGPPTVNIPSAHPTLETLRLDVLTPETSASSVLRTALNASFPRGSEYLSESQRAYHVDDHFKDGTPSWFILDSLVPGQRYEVRVCWAATQPTTFQLEAFPLDTVFNTPSLMQSLDKYSSARQALHKPPVKGLTLQPDQREASILLLRIVSAADYFSLNKTLMRNVQPVRVDIILDPFLLNILPRSLLPIAGYIVVIAAGSWFLARYIAAEIKKVALKSGHGRETKKTQ